MITAAFLLTSALVCAPRADHGADVAAARLIAGTKAEGESRKRSRRRLPRPRSGMPCEEDDDPTTPTKGTSSAGVMATRAMCSMYSAVRPTAPNPGATPRHILLQILLI